MSRAVIKHKSWLIPLCLLAAAIASLYGWQQLQAQNVAPGMEGAPPGVAGPPVAPPTPGAPGAVPAPVAPPAEPTCTLSSVLPSGVRSMKIKNWDGTVTELLRFKYKTMDHRLITVHLPAIFKKEQKTKAGWDTLFQVFGMDYEARVDAIQRNQPPDLSAFMGQLMAEIQGQVPLALPGGSSPAAQAMDYARSNLPSIYGGSVTLPPLLPGMF